MPTFVGMTVSADLIGFLEFIGWIPTSSIPAATDRRRWCWARHRPPAKSNFAPPDLSIAKPNAPPCSLTAAADLWLTGYSGSLPAGLTPGFFLGPITT
jgi:hypothetical protein